MNTTLIIVAALLAPLLLAAAVGFPTWIAVRTHDNYLKLRDDYRAAVGLPSIPASVPLQPGVLHPWLFNYFLYVSFMGVLRMIHSSLGFTAHLLIFAGLGFWFLQKAFRSFAVLRSHPDLDSNLRRVPTIEIVTWSVVGFAFLVIVHIMVVIIAPSEFSDRLH